MSGYNGWSNYETWNVALWLDNDEGSYHYWRAIAEEIAETAGENQITTLPNPTYELSQLLKDHHEEHAPELAGTYADLLGAALSEVDWHEIAEHLLEEVITT
jgi:hypothetical protein